MTEKRTPGRPKRYPNKRRTWTVRLSDDLGQAVVASAIAAGRSISEEIEYRLQTAHDQSALIRELKQGLAEDIAALLRPTISSAVSPNPNA